MPESALLPPRPAWLPPRPPPSLGGAGPADLHQSRLSVLPNTPQPTTSVANANAPGPGPQSLEPQLSEQAELPPMAPSSRQDLLAKEHFAFVFDKAKTQSYNDPAAKGPGSHT